MIERDLIHGEFKNYGFEYKILKKKKINTINTTNLYGIKYYKSNNKYYTRARFRWFRC